MLIHPKTLRKLKAIEERYTALRYEVIADLEMEMHETMEHHHGVPQSADWRPVEAGRHWGRNFGTAWFRGRVTIPSGHDGSPVYLHARVGLEEPEPQQALLFIDGRPCGVFDFQHSHVRIPGEAVPGWTMEAAIEAYAGHTFPRFMPDDAGYVIGDDCREYTGVFLCRERRDVTGFVYDLRALRQLEESLDGSSLRRGELARTLERVFAIVDAKPAEAGEASWRPRLEQAREVMRPQLEKRNGPTTPIMGLIGHSHIDTAWLWTIAETHRKAARTFSSMVNLLDQYPEGIFIQSAPYHLDAIRHRYPSLFEDIRRLHERGSWEPNGAMWIEPDCNIPSGESFVRQLLMGQTATREMFGYTADTLWQPDVFGYSAALPQILRSGGVRFFCTTKMSWNDTTRHPYDTFHWVGLDGSSVVAHFNTIHARPEPKWLIEAWRNQVQHPDTQDRHLAAYGWGDGGGGPTEAMFEMARRTADLEGCPRVEHTTVTRFMEHLEADADRLPSWQGELYLELHRGTLTSIAAIKKGNRRMEDALHDAEFLWALAARGGQEYPREAFEVIWKEFLVNQFHDILPGTSIKEVNDEAVASFANLLVRTRGLVRSALEALLGPEGDSGPLRAHLVNTCGWERRGPLALSGIPDGYIPAGGHPWQRVETLTGGTALVVAGIGIPAHGSVSLDLKREADGGSGQASPFRVGDDRVETPFHTACFDAAGRITSLVSRATGREWVAEGGAFNAILMGEDVPEIWDNWDIDSDQDLKLLPQDALLSSEVAADGPLQLRLRRTYRLGRKSTLVQDVVFHGTTPRIDFETRVDWAEVYQHLKVSFATNLPSATARHEIQFGHVIRPTHRNLPQDRARFEVCNHRWTDLSDEGAGVALLNDCKYGIAMRGPEMRLSLIKSGRHPDPRGDEGIHEFAYSLLPHEEPFSVPAVVYPATEMNRPVVAHVTPRVGNAGLAALFSVDQPNVIIDTLKRAEDGRGLILRLYEAGCRSGTVRLSLQMPVRCVVLTNVLEEDQEEVTVEQSTAELAFRPFELKTLRIVER